MWSLLNSFTIRTIWIGEIINEFGNGLNFWAMAWLMFRAYPDQPWVAASLLSVQVVGLLLGSVVLGPNLDHWNRRRVLIGSNLALALLVGLIPFLLGIQGGLVGLYVVIFLVGVVISTTIPSLEATLPSLVPPERLQPLQALFALTFSFSNVAAPLCAGLLIAALGASTVMWVNALTFLFAAGCYLWVRFPVQQFAARDGGSALQQWTMQIRAGLGFVRSRAAIWGLILMVSSVNALSDPYNALFLPRVAERLFENVQLPSWLGSDPQAAGLGLFDTVAVNIEFVATLWLGARSFSNRVALLGVFLGCLLATIGMLGAVLAPNLAISLVFCGLQGLGFAPLGVLVGTLVGRMVPEDLRGRVGSVRLFLGQGLRPLTLSMVGVLITPMGLGGVSIGIFLVVALLLGFGVSKAARDV